MTEPPTSTADYYYSSDYLNSVRNVGHKPESSVLHLTCHTLVNTLIMLLELKQSNMWYWQVGEGASNRFQNGTSLMLRCYNKLCTQVCSAEYLEYSIWQEFFYSETHYEIMWNAIYSSTTNTWIFFLFLKYYFCFLASDNNWLIIPWYHLGWCFEYSIRWMFADLPVLT